MSETNVKETEIMEMETEEAVEEVAEKPYTFRRFSSTDIFPMFRIIGKIGLKEFTAAIDKDVLNELVTKFIEDNKEEKEDVSNELIKNGQYEGIGEYSSKYGYDKDEGSSLYVIDNKLFEVEYGQVYDIEIVGNQLIIAVSL